MERTAGGSVYGLVGRTLGHSWSAPIHGALGNEAYRLIELEPEELAPFLSRPDIAGLNVTIPYKRDVVPHCDELSDDARAIGSVNTIVRNEDGQLIGHNTDAFGFGYLLDSAGISVAGEKVLVFGDGGASATVQWVLGERGAEVVVVSRSGPVTYADLDDHRDAGILINTTPLGMSPDVERMPVDPGGFPEATAAVDLIYNPFRTVFLQRAQDAGMRTADGLSMLVAQAVRAHELFFDTEVPRTGIERIIRDLRTSMTNIVLVGMPGSGKSTIGSLLGELSERPVLDTDAMIVERSGTPIPEIFASHGEPHFRELEHEAVREATSQHGAIIVTGGGAVLSEKNRALLRSSGLVYFLERDIDVLPRDGRPLSQNADLKGMYERRKPLYEAAADIVISNDRDPEAVAESIWRGFREDPDHQRA